MQNLYVQLAPSLVAIIELVLLFAAAALILFSYRRAQTFSQYSSRRLSFRRLECTFTRIAANRGLAALAVGFAVIVLRAALIPILGIPQPRWNDEFSYLLAADTFAHGRITNPTHPMWIHFESFHIIEHPTYMSMYPPGQGLVLAAGQALGQPYLGDDYLGEWIGQLLVTGAMCSALCWMLQAWLPARWALLGSILAALRLGILSYWMNSYWCASLAALGGALVLGAWPRLRRHPSMRVSIFMALGLIILANTRPYEGLVFSIPIAAAMLLWMAGRGCHDLPDRPVLHVTLSRIIVPILLTLALGTIATGYYYYRVTGDPLRMAYQVNRETYAMAPYFIWQTPRPEPEYHHEIMRQVYERELAEFEKYRTLSGFFPGLGWKLKSWWQFYLGPLLTLPLLALPWVVRRRKMFLPLVICVAVAAAFAVQTWTLPHYFSPVTCILYLLLVQCLRHLWHWWRPLGREIVRAIVVVACAMILLRVSAAGVHARIEPAWPRGNLERAAILHQLQLRPESQLVIVRYGPHHDLDKEWVYNEANIDTAKVIWARDMGRNDNQELLEYFRDRKVWMVDGDSPSPQPLPYPD
ncbi:MAG TPA: hypothetical protein VGM18_07780 [Candidatus Sulfotelmatobacter sp.]|jgi:hypothetical protein